MIPGVKITMGGRDWEVPPLNLKGVKEVQSLLPQLNGSLGPEAIGAVLKVVTLALRRNYPEVTEEQIEDMVDLGNMPAIVGAVMNVSGLVPKAMTGEVVAPVVVDPAP